MLVYFIAGCAGPSPLCAVLLWLERALLSAVASLVGNAGSRAWDSVVVADGRSCSSARGLCPDQQSNPRLLN